MTPPDAGWDAETSAKDVLEELSSTIDMTAWSQGYVHDIELLTIIARHLTVARSTAPSVEAMREAAANVVDQCNLEGPYNAIGAASRIRALPLPPAQPPAEAAAPELSRLRQQLKDCQEELEHERAFSLAGADAFAQKEFAYASYHETQRAEIERLKALPHAQPPAVGKEDAQMIVAALNSDVTLSSIPAAEIEALRKVVTVELERDEWNHHVAMHLRNFLARTQSPTPAGEGETTGISREQHLENALRYLLERCEYRPVNMHMGATAPMLSTQGASERKALADARAALDRPIGPTLPAVRRAVQAALGAGLCPEDAVVLEVWVKEHGGVGT